MEFYVPEGNDSSPKKKRTKKEDRPFLPETLGWTNESGVFVQHLLRPSEYNIAGILLDHFSHTNSDDKYRRVWDKYVSEFMSIACKEAGTREKYPPYTLRASSIAKCARWSAMSMMGFKGEDTGASSPHWAVSAAFGESQHQLIQAALHFTDLVEDSEFVVKSPSGSLMGRADVLLKADGGYPRAVLDIKTVNETTFKEGLYGPKFNSYIPQVTTYAHIVGVDVGIVLLVDRGTGRMVDFSWDIDHDYGEFLLKRADSIVRLAKSNTLPEAEKRINGKWSHDCFAFCPFRALCFHEEDTSALDRMGQGNISIKLLSGVQPEEISVCS